MDTIENLLLGLYRAARELPLPEFKEEALSELRRALHCDSAMWGVGDASPTNGLATTGVHIKNQSHAVVVSCEEIEVLNHVVRAASQACTINVPVVSALTSAAGSEAHSTTHEMQNLLVMTLPGKPMPSLGCISLWRARECDHYSEEERHLAGALLPHVFEAGMINRLLWCDHFSVPPDECHPREGSANCQLTRAERAVAEEIARGLSYKEAARILGIAPSTVRNQLHAVYTKLGVRSEIAISRYLRDTHV